MRIFFEKYFKNSINIKNKFISNKIVISTLEEISDLIFKTVKKEKKILTCGNGGSFSDASHMTTELMVRYSKEFNRKPISCINLSNDGSLITAHTNDFNFETLFSRSLEGLGEKGDCLIIFSTSNSNNIINVLKIAKKLGIHSIGFLGNDGGLAKELCDIPLIVNSNKTSHIQECHIVCIHAIVESLEINLSSQ